MRFTASAPPGRHKRRRATKRFAVFAVMVAILAVGLLLFTRVCAQSEKTVHTGCRAGLRTGAAARGGSGESPR